MGIKSLTKLIKSHSPDSIETSQLYKLSGKKVAIDASLVIYQCLMNIRHNGKNLQNINNKITSHITGIFYKNINYLSMNITPIYIFDGKPPHDNFSYAMSNRAMVAHINAYVKQYNKGIILLRTISFKV